MNSLTDGTTCRRARRWALWAFLLALAPALSTADEPRPRKTKSLKGTNRVKSGRRVRPVNGADSPPPCLHEKPKSQPAQSMPELFQRMGDQFARNPARGFDGFVQELSALEGPALRGVSVEFTEERAAGQKARREYLDNANTKG